MAVKDILQLGHPDLYKVSQPVTPDDLSTVAAVVTDLHDTMMDFRRRYNAGRAIAAPQISVPLRLIYMHAAQGPFDEPTVFINPRLEQKSAAMMTVWDDCMSFPDLFVKMERHQSCRIAYRDMNWAEQFMDLEGDLSELLQHEYDHLDGILAVARALDGQSFCLRSERETRFE
ncbi:peptide deformylase [Chloroflexota bacterium]